MKKLAKVLFGVLLVLILAASFACEQSEETGGTGVFHRKKKAAKPQPPAATAPAPATQQPANTLPPATETKPAAPAPAQEKPKI